MGIVPQVYAWAFLGWTLISKSLLLFLFMYGLKFYFLNFMTLIKPCCCCCYVASVVSNSVQPHRRQLTRLPWPWDSPGKNTGVGCHFLLQCMKVRSESEVAQSCPTLWPHGLQPTRLPCPSPTPRACSNSCPSSQWCHPTISSSVVPFSSCLQSFPAWGSFLRSQFFASGGQSIRVLASASVLSMNI